MTTTDFFAPLRKQAQRALALLSKEIEQRQAELHELVSHADLLRSTIGGGSKRGPGRPPGTQNPKPTGPFKRATKPVSGKRLSWDEVLSGLPKTFTVNDVMKQPGVAAKGRAQVYPALDRWLQAKKAKRVGKGEYRKL